MRRGGLRPHSRFRLFRLSAPKYQTMIRFHTPFFEPYMSYERVRLSNKAFTRSPWESSAARAGAGTAHSRPRIVSALKKAATDKRRFRDQPRSLEDAIRNLASHLRSIQLIDPLETEDSSVSIIHRIPHRGDCIPDRGVRHAQQVVEATRRSELSRRCSHNNPDCAWPSRRQQSTAFSHCRRANRFLCAPRHLTFAWNET